MILGYDIALDLGTSSIVVAARGRGVISREPAVVAMDKNTGRVLAVGQDAQRMLGRTPANIVDIHPVRDGAISDFDMTERLIREMIRKVGSVSLFRPRILVAVPSGITEIEERAVCDACIQAGARKVYLIESSIAAALGAGLDITKPQGFMIIDSGAGCTDVAVISMSGIACSESIKVAGATYEDAIINYVRRKHSLLIGRTTAESVKQSIGCVYPRPEPLQLEVKGRCLLTGLPRVIVLTSDDIYDAFEETSMQIMDAVHRVLENTSPELVADISANGITLTGGSSLIWGLDRLIETNTNIPTRIADDAELCVAYGTEKALVWLNDMQEGPLYIARRRQLK